MRKIKITIGDDGAQQVEVFGATGDECLEMTRELERRLGHTAGERTRKPEEGEAPEGESPERSEIERG